MAMSKDKQQVVKLSLVLAVIAGVLLYFYGGALLPHPDGVAPIEEISKVNLPSKFDETLFDRTDYKALKPTTGVPVKPFTEIPRNSKIFEKTK
jgi:hypothetical protein